MSYKGRFAPSPSGPLHQGSLIAALGSYLDARANKGQWLLRIEDIDPPREDPNSKKLIPQQLEQHGLHWDESIYFQSKRSTLYLEHLQQLASLNQTYFCDCTRQRIKSIGGKYEGFCRNRQLNEEDTSVRIRFDHKQGSNHLFEGNELTIEWNDLIKGHQLFTNDALGGDFVLKRRDGLFSYQLAVAIDDALDSFTHIIRGEDLLDSTPRQLFIQNALNLHSPKYGHLPLLLDSGGLKLSKQNHAPSLDKNRPQNNLYFALKFLGQNPLEELKTAKVDEIIQWAIAHWKRSKTPKNGE